MELEFSYCSLTRLQGASKTQGSDSEDRSLHSSLQSIHHNEMILSHE